MHRMPDWFRPVGVDLSPQRAKPTPALIPPAARPALARGTRFVAILASVLVLAGAVVLVVAAQPVAGMAWLVGGAVLGALIRIAWRASR